MTTMSPAPQKSCSRSRNRSSPYRAVMNHYPLAKQVENAEVSGRSRCRLSVSRDASGFLANHRRHEFTRSQKKEPLFRSTCTTELAPLDAYFVSLVFLIV